MRLAVIALLAGCSLPAAEIVRSDTARVLEVALDGSHQNACWSPDGSRLALTQWIGGYNTAPARIAVVSRDGGDASMLTTETATSVNMPGACWRGDRIAYSADEFDDEIYTIRETGSDARRLTDRTQHVAYEPTFSPDGQWLVFESHVLDVETGGAIFKMRADGTELTQLTDGRGDDRQPNWSPRGDAIVFQSHARTGDIDLWVIRPDGTGLRNVTQSPASEDTDAAFSPDGTRMIYSSNLGDLPHANLFAISIDGGAPTRITQSAGYDGAPSWSPDGKTVAFEASPGDPDETGTMLMLVGVE